MEKDEIIDYLVDGREIIKELDDEEVYRDPAEWSAIMDIISDLNRAISIFKQRKE